MSGLNLRGIRVDATPALTQKKPANLTVTGTVSDPIPAANAYSLKGERKFTPGHSAPDPKPATAAKNCYVGSWHGAESAVVDPIPARSI
jgi:hypothetical protein